MMLAPLGIACLDVGAETGWATGVRGRWSVGSVLVELVGKLDRILSGGGRIALGIESPLYVPRRAAPAEVRKGRIHEGNRAWSASAGCTALATGLVQLDWMLREIKERHPKLLGTTRWTEFGTKGRNLFLWEGFVTGSQGDQVDLPFVTGEHTAHSKDALAAAILFKKMSDGGEVLSVLGEEPALSLAGTALLANGLSGDLSLLTDRCVVVKARKPA